MGSTYVNIILVTILLIFIILRITAEQITRHHYGQKYDFFKHNLVKPGDIVFLGDSITDGACWDELFPGLPVKNRGIINDNTQGVLARLGEILIGKPAAIFLLIGTNDLPLYAYHTDIGILYPYAEILRRCKSDSPDTCIFVQSIFPRGSMYTGRILRLNAKLKDLAAKYDCTFIDLFPRLAGVNGGLRRELTNDNLHLLGAGYDEWVEEIRPFIESVLR